MFSHAYNRKQPTERQVIIWNLNRDNLTGREIAKKIDVDPAFVSRSLKEANKRIKGLLEDTGRMNKIKLDLVNGELGFARGHSHIFNISAYLTFSPINGLQVWYSHKGECNSCEEFLECRNALLQEFKERNIEIPDEIIQPTDLSDLLFQKIEEMLA